jgi:glutathione transport system permease protein
MLAFAVRRVLVSIPILFASSFLAYCLTYISADPVARLYEGRNPRPPAATVAADRHRLWLDQGFFQQYWTWLTNLMTHGSFGPSINPSSDIGHDLATKLLVTARLVGAAMIIALILAVITGVLSAYRQYSKMDYSFTLLGFLFLSMPAFWIAVLLKQGAITYNEATGSRFIGTLFERSPIPKEGLWESFSDIVGHLILPTFSLALITYAAWSRFQRGSMLEVLNSDYIRLARAKGLKPRRVMIRHALRTALIPMTTVSALTIAGILGGAIITETVFNWKGMGLYIIGRIGEQDRWAIQGWLVVTGFIVIMGNLLADLLYAVLDPRIRYE